MISLILSSPRKVLTLCSPKTHKRASTTLLLPLPLGPTIAHIFLSKSNSVLSAKDLNPCILILFIYIIYLALFLKASLAAICSASFLDLPMPLPSVKPSTIASALNKGLPSSSVILSTS